MGRQEMKGIGGHPDIPRACRFWPHLLLLLFVMFSEESSRQPGRESCQTGTTEWTAAPVTRRTPELAEHSLF